MSTRLVASLAGLAFLFFVVEALRAPDEVDDAAVQQSVDNRLNEVMAGLLRGQSEQALLVR
ncbi:MAG: hypothetical protein FJ086_15595 [Deltaproteobacteria bacterium]|nr:hypothetical protein [Deltaproteobacteria bacterium]